MKVLKKVLLLAALGVSGLLTSPVFAQEAAPRQHGAKKEMAEKRFNEFSEKLKLTSDQQAKLKTIMQSSRQEIKAARANTDKMEKRKAVAASLKKADEQIIAILDDSQKVLYTQHKEQKKAEMREKAEERRRQKQQMKEDTWDEGIF